VTRVTSTGAAVLPPEGSQRHSLGAYTKINLKTNLLAHDARGGTAVCTSPIIVATGWGFSSFSPSRQPGRYPPSNTNEVREPREVGDDFFSTS